MLLGTLKMWNAGVKTLTTSEPPLSSLFKQTFLQAAIIVDLLFMLTGGDGHVLDPNIVACFFLALAALACAPDSSGGGRLGGRGGESSMPACHMAPAGHCMVRLKQPLAPTAECGLTVRLQERGRGTEGRGTFTVEKVTSHRFMGGGRGIF